MSFEVDRLVFTPDDVDLTQSPLRGSVAAETYTLGAFNPGFTRLPNGDLLMMVRVAEALRQPIVGDAIHAIRWDLDGTYHLDPHALSDADTQDPRKFMLREHHHKVMALTSLSWLLPVQLTPDGLAVRQVHYDKAIAPAATWQEYGVEDARISLIDGVYYMTTCSVSAERHSTTLYTSTDGLNYALQGIVLDHQNKDMLFFEGRIDGRFWALTRPLGDLYFAYPPNSPYRGGPSINLASSPDALHWKPYEGPGIRPRKGTTISARMGGGAQPVRTDAGWLVLYHGVESAGVVGIYRTFWALLDLEDPSRILRLEDQSALLEPAPELTKPIEHQMYLSDVVFTTGVIDAGDYYIVASGEADLACRITHIPKSRFA
ncbi:MAG: glycosidase [Caulobacterales bacterium]|nr:glycosidase [Caulobacterales bacterium]